MEAGTLLISIPLINTFSCGGTGLWMKSSLTPRSPPCWFLLGSPPEAKPQPFRLLRAEWEAHGSGAGEASRSRLRLGGRAASFVN